MAEVAQDAARRSILLLDDHPAIRNALARIMKKKWEILHASSASEARAHLKAEDPVGAIVDLGLPGGDALPLIAELSEHRIKVVVLSATDDDATVARVFAAGASGFLAKARHEQEV